MATYVAPKAGAGVQPHDFKPGSNWITSTFTLADAIDSTDGGGTGGAALANADVIQMLKVPKGARVLEVILTTTDLDTNGTPTLSFDVGDGDDVDRYIDGSTIGRTGGTDRLGSGIVTNTQAFTYTANDTIDVLVAAGPATGATSGTISLTVGFTTDI